MNRKAEIVLLAGFLGSGKTTLLKRILSWETNLSDTVVVVNEFGDVGIDGSLFQDTGSDVVELTSGCICCTLKIDLQQTLKRIRERFNPRQIFIEASGIADPTTIESVLNEPDMREHLKLRKIVTVLDAECWKAREVFGTVFYNQLNLADLILLNKIDLLDQDQIPQFLKEIHDAIPHCRTVPTIRCRIDPETIWADSSRKNTALKLGDFAGRTSAPNISGKEAHHRHGAGDVHATEYKAFSFQDSRPLDEAGFKRFVQDLPWELFRLKGSVRFQDRTVRVNFVGGKCEWACWKGPPETRLAFIGWNISKDETLKNLKKCLVETLPGQAASKKD